MGDEFDACECVWSHEYAMQRLIAFIRQSQNHCTDNECVDVSGRLPASSPNLFAARDESSNFTMMTMFMIFAVIMYFIRPESILNLTNTKRRTGGQDPPTPPPPPPAPPAVN